MDSFPPLQHHSPRWCGCPRGPAQGIRRCNRPAAPLHYAQRHAGSTLALCGGRPMHRLTLAALALWLGGTAPLWTQEKKAQDKKPAPPPRPAPTAANVAYGTHERQVLDFWQARSDRPTPLVLYIHGGGWQNGD